MKFKELTIYGYGKFENKHIPLSNEEIQIIYGENEAGKSTLMSFIHSILFGFPTKQQNEKRYEPKRGGKYGGSILIETDEHTVLTVERIAGKATGDCFVYDENGHIKQQSELQELLKGMDKSTYTSIFSFDLNGLQHVYELNREALGKYLFLSTMFGSDALYFLQDQLEKKKEQLYKPNGRKPLLNTMLEELKQTNEALVNAKAYEDDYQRLLKERETIKDELEQFRSEKIQIQSKLKRVGKLHAIFPLLEQRNECIRSLEKLPERKSFPDNGRMRLEQLLARLKPLEGQLHTLKTKKDELQREWDQFSMKGERIEEDWQQFVHLKENYSLIRKYVEEETSLSFEMEQLTERIHEDLHYLFGTTDVTVIENINTSMIVKEKIKAFVKNYNHFWTKKQWLDDQFEKAKEALEESEEQLKKFQSLLLNRIEYEQLVKEQYELEEKLEQASQYNVSQEEYNRVSEQLRKRERHFEKSQKRFKQIFMTTAIASVIAAVILFLLDLPYLAVSVLFANVFSFMFRPAKDDLFLYLKERQAELKQMVETVHETAIQDWKRRLSHIQFSLAKEEQMKQKIELERLNVDQKEQAYDRIVSQFEQWEKELHTLMEEMRPLYKLLNVPEDFAADVILERYEMIAQCQKRLKEREQIEQKRSFMQTKINEFNNELTPFIEKYKIKRDNLERTIHKLNQTLERLVQTKTALERVTEEWGDVHTLYEQLHHELGELLNKANVHSVEQFREKIAALEKRIELEKQLQWIQSQIQSKGFLSSTELKELPESKEDLLVEETALEASLAEVMEKEETCQKRLAEVQIHLEKIEESGVYSELRYEYAMKKSRAKQIAKKWAIHTVAQDLLRKTVEHHRKHRLPQLLKKAEQHFRFLTNSRYTSILLLDDHPTLLVKRKDGMLFHANELSQGTAEQLYVAIRFALVEYMSERVKLPIMVDDSFVNFDHERFKRAVQLIRMMSKDYQVLLFTCHHHIASAFYESEIYRLPSNEDQIQMKRG
ncbi:AAA family ATPase [Bacillus sp. FJAT-47783]|uniref:ATP-binding protein n=1 Tax=Bacillus sp. FJAT-47783 TaxID=2922712 RepID=UPI001FACE865|nr:AAA family ATPase [Bacillus sp. FJAT-47783]